MPPPPTIQTERADVRSDSRPGTIRSNWIAWRRSGPRSMPCAETAGCVLTVVVVANRLD